MDAKENFGRNSPEFIDAAKKELAFLESLRETII